MWRLRASQPQVSNRVRPRLQPPDHRSGRQAPSIRTRSRTPASTQCRITRDGRPRLARRLVGTRAARRARYRPPRAQLVGAASHRPAYRDLAPGPGSVQSPQRRQALRPTDQTVGEDSSAVLSYGDYFKGYRRHPELKALADDGKPCHTWTRGVLTPRQIMGTRLQRIGKESNRLGDGPYPPMMNRKPQSNIPSLEHALVATKRSADGESGARRDAGNEPLADVVAVRQTSPTRVRTPAKAPQLGSIRHGHGSLHVPA
jgi:hypothetical protein